MKKILIVTCVFYLSTSNILAQDKLKVELKEAPKPDIYIDGKKYDHDIFDLLDQSKIESVNVIKDEKALKEYNAPNGVIIIKTKKAAQQIVTVDEKEVNVTDSDKDPVIVIDGKISNRETLSKLAPDDIETIDVLKGQAAIEKYNAPNGAVIVKTKNTK